MLMAVYYTVNFTNFLIMVASIQQVFISVLDRDKNIQSFPFKVQLGYDQHKTPNYMFLYIWQITGVTYHKLHIWFVYLMKVIIENNVD